LRPAQCAAFDLFVAAGLFQMLPAYRSGKNASRLFASTIGAAIAARYWFLWVRCPACRKTIAVDLRTLDRRADAAVIAGL
jgi:hypothetical protein